MAKKKAKNKPPVVAAAPSPSDVIDPDKAGWVEYQPPGMPYTIMIPPGSAPGDTAPAAAPAAAAQPQEAPNTPATGEGGPTWTPVVPDYLQAMFAQFNLPQLAQWYVQRAIELGPGGEAQIAVEVYDRPEYQALFPAMKALRARGRAMSEGEYIAVQKSYESIMGAYGLKGSAFDNGDTYAKLMESEVSARELEERVADAKMVISAADPNVKRALTDFYGINENDLMIYALDPKGVGKDHVDKLARSATLAGLASTMSISLDRAYTEQLAMDSSFDNAREADYREAVSQIADLNTAQSRLAAIDREAYSVQDAGDVVVKKDAGKILASRRRAQREAARFSGTAGVGSSSLVKGTL